MDIARPATWRVARDDAGGVRQLATKIIILTVAIVLVGGFLLNSRGADGLAAFSDVSLMVVSVSGGLFTLFIALRLVGSDRRSWLFIGAGILSWGLGQSTWAYIELILGRDRPFPSLADVGYILMIPLMFIGLLTMPATRPRRDGRLTVSLDAFIVMASILTVSWFAVLGPIYAQADVPWDAKLIGLLYPAGDLLLLFALIGGIARGWLARRDPVVIALLVGIGLFIAADLGFAFLTVNNAYESGSIIDLGWPFGFLFATYAASLRWAKGNAAAQAVQPGESERSMDAVLRLAVYPLVLGVAGLLFVSNFSKRPVSLNIFVFLALATMILIVVREFVTLRENERLNHDLLRFSHGLEVLVRDRTASLTALHDLAANLCSAASADEVCQVGLSTLQTSVRGTAAVLYLEDQRGWYPVVGYPEIPSDQVAPSIDVVARLHDKEIVCEEGAETGRGTVWVPASERGQVYGCIAVFGGELDRADDTQYLATIGAEFGVAYEDQRRFEAAHQNEARFRSLVQNSSDSVTIIDVDGIIRYHSPAAQRLFGDDPNTLIGTNVVDLLHPDDVSQAYAFLAEVVARPVTTVAVEWRRRVPDGWHFVETLATNLLGDASVEGIVLNSRDINERRLLEDQLTVQAFHDPLTGLANRALFRDRVEHGLARSHRRKQSMAVLFLDVDNFKTVNDSLGHAAGDQLLVGISERLVQCVRDGDTVARLGGDEFATLLEDIGRIDEAIIVAERITLALKAPFHLEGRDVFITASVGIALNDADYVGTLEILRNADVAMYRAKDQRQGRHATFDPEMHTVILRRLELQADLRRALDRCEFVLHYQPLVDLRTGAITGMEALVRWNHPTRGLVPPSEFIPVAEETGVIVPLGRWVLQQACHEARQWQLEFPNRTPLILNVNLSARQLQEGDLLQDVANSLRTSGLAPEHLVLEITESVLMRDAETAVGWLRDLKRLGVQLAIDDFGTGYSSLGYLRQFPVDTLKIDKTFVAGIGEESGRSTLASAIMDLGRTLGLKTVAEGIEQPMQLIELLAMGCESGQGFHFAAPLDRADFLALLHRDSSALAPSAVLV